MSARTMADIVARTDAELARMRDQQRPWRMWLGAVEIGRRESLPAAIRAMNQARSRQGGRAAIEHASTGERWERTFGTHWERVRAAEAGAA